VQVDRSAHLLGWESLVEMLSVTKPGGYMAKKAAKKAAKKTAKKR
jgi:hypothetical protein